MLESLTPDQLHYTPTVCKDRDAQLIMIELQGLFAYPSRPAAIGSTLLSALESLRLEGIGQGLTSWEENDIPGKFIVDPVLSQIDDGNILIADITRLNFNVTFEIGYAIGRGKRVALIKNSSLTGSEELIRQVGIFDTLGYKNYSNSSQLANFLRNVTDLRPLTISETINTAAPVYLFFQRLKLILRSEQSPELRRLDYSSALLIQKSGQD